MTGKGDVNLISGLMNFISIIKNPKTVDDLNDKELLHIIKNVNFRFMDKLTKEGYRQLVEEDEDLFDKITNSKDLESVIRCIRFKDLFKDEIVEVLKLLVENNPDLDNNTIIKLWIKMLSEVTREKLVRILENPIIEDLINDKVLGSLRKLINNSRYCGNFLRNLNTLLDKIEEERS